MMRDVYLGCLTERMEEDPRVLVLGADLMHSDGTATLQDIFPRRVVNVGVQEAHMVSMAAGLAAVGKIPLAHTFACFHARRSLDQAYISAAYARLPVKLIGTDPGITAAFNGATHMPLEDMGIMRSVPEMIVVEPTDPELLRSLLPQIIYASQPVYMRLYRKEVPAVHPVGTEAVLGRGIVLRDGSDASILASGLMVAEALAAAHALRQQGLQVRVVDMFTLKPLDRRLVYQCAVETGAIVTAENHSVINGLGAAVAETLADLMPVPLERVGVQDRFGEVGSPDFLMQRFHMTAGDIVGAVRRVLGRKRRLT